MMILKHYQYLTVLIYLHKKLPLLNCALLGIEGCFIYTSPVPGTQEDSQYIFSKKLNK